MADVKLTTWDQLYIGATLWHPNNEEWVVLLEERQGWWLAQGAVEQYRFPPALPNVAVYISESTEDEAVALVQHQLGGEVIHEAAALSLPAIYWAKPLQTHGNGVSDAAASHLFLMHGTYVEDVKTKPRIKGLLECHETHHSEGLPPTAIPHEHRERP